jgi:ribonuclease III
MEKPDYTDISQAIEYEFKNLSFLDEAFRHSSFVNEQNDKSLLSNERMEFLGDAVLSLAIGHLLMIRHPDVNEGLLSKMRAGLVNEIQISEISRNINLGKNIKLGKGEMMSDGCNKQSILADALEALIAAVYLDGGYPEAFRIIERLFDEPLNFIDTGNVNIDYKSRLQELIQLHQIPMPEYAIISETGPDHDKTFTVGLTFDAITATGTGKNKKAAEQEAAKTAYKALKNHLNLS